MPTRRRNSAVIAALGFSFGLLALRPFADDGVQQPLSRPAAPSQTPCLSEPEHWSAMPNFARGTELSLSRFLRFHTSDGRTINARMFLTEFHPNRIEFPPDMPPDQVERRRKVSARMACIGHEINVDEGYVPDFDVPARYVRSTGPCAFSVDLGAVQCFVRTTEQ